MESFENDAYPVIVENTFELMSNSNICQPDNFSIYTWIQLSWHVMPQIFNFCTGLRFGTSYRWDILYVKVPLFETATLWISLWIRFLIYEISYSSDIFLCYIFIIRHPIYDRSYIGYVKHPLYETFYMWNLFFTRNLIYLISYVWEIFCKGHLSSWSRKRLLWLDRPRQSRRFPFRETRPTKTKHRWNNR